MRVDALKDRRIVITAVLVLIIAAAITSLTMNKADAETSIAVEEVRAKKGDIKIDLVSDGVIEYNSVYLQFGVNGVLKEILVNEGDKVESGQIIARLDDRKNINDIDTAKVKLQKAENDVEKIKLQYLPMEKIPEAYAPVEIETKKLDLANSNADLLDAQVNLQKAENSLQDTYLKSPIQGTVVQINGNLGEVISSSSSDGTKAFAVVSEQKIKVVAKVLELDIAMVSRGQKTEVELEAFPDEVFTGSVSRIAFLPTTDSNGIVAYAVEIELDKMNDSLREGMTCVISFIIKEVNDVIILPNRAVRIVDGKQFVDIKKEDGEILSQEIKTGFTDGSYVEVKEGLQSGDIVLLNK